jgi:Zn ribbon nucleic-acid-binding protein
MASALLSLSPDLRETAAVMKYTEDGLLQSVRAGTNGFFCVMDRPGDDRFSVECHPESIRAYVERRQHLYLKGGRALRDSLLAIEVKSGKVNLPTGAISHFISGALNPDTGVPDTVRVWDEIDVPFAEPKTTGHTTENAGAAPWLMSEGTVGAHIMVDYRKVAWTDLQPSPSADEQQIRAVLNDYIVGWREGNVEKLSGIFAHDEGRVQWVSERDGREVLNAMTFGDVLKQQKARPAYGLQWRVLDLDIIDNELAVAKLQISRSNGHYIDFLILQKINDRWRIINKTFVTR